MIFKNPGGWLKYCLKNFSLQLVSLLKSHAVWVARICMVDDGGSCALHRQCGRRQFRWCLWSMGGGAWVVFVAVCWGCFVGGNLFCLGVFCCIFVEGGPRGSGFRGDPLKEGWRDNLWQTAGQKEILSLPIIFFFHNPSVRFIKEQKINNWFWPFDSSLHQSWTCATQMSIQIWNFYHQTSPNTNSLKQIFDKCIDKIPFFSWLTSKT